MESQNLMGCRWRRLSLQLQLPLPWYPSSYYPSNWWQYTEDTNRVVILVACTIYFLDKFRASKLVPECLQLPRHWHMEIQLGERPWKKEGSNYPIHLLMTNHNASSWSDCFKVGSVFFTMAHVIAKRSVNPAAKVRMSVATSQVFDVKTPPERWAPRG